jgi:signal transduction histidine kinase
LSTLRDQAKINLIAAALAIVLVIWGVLEFALHTLRPDAIEREYRISGQFAATNKTIWERHAELQIGALDLAMNLGEISATGGRNLDSIEKEINSAPFNVHTAVFHNGTLVMWSDGLTPSLLQAHVGNKSAIHTDDSGFYLLASANISAINGTWQVFRSRRIFELQNSDPVYGDVYSPEETTIKRTAPSLFYLVGSPHMLPVGYRFNIMTVMDERTTGFFVVSINDPVIRRYLHPQLDRIMRTLVLTILIILIWLLIRIWFSAEQFHHRTGYYLLLIWSSFGFSWYLGIPDFLRALSGTNNIGYQLSQGSDIIELILSTLVLVLSVVLIIRALVKQQRYYGIKWAPRTVAASFALGITSGISFGWLFSRINAITQLIEAGFLEPTLMPALSTMVLFTIGGLSILSIVLFNLTLSWFFTHSEKNERVTIASIGLVSLVFTYYIAVYQSHSGESSYHLINTSWIGLWAAITMFVGIILPGNYGIFRFAGPVRVTLATSIIVAIVIIPSFVSRTYLSVDQDLLRIASGIQTGSDRVDDKGMQKYSPHMVLVFHNDEVVVSGDFITGQFPEHRFLPEYIKLKLQSESAGFSTHRGAYFRYREFAQQINDTQHIVVRMRLPSASNFIYAAVRFILTNILILALLQLVLHYFGFRIHQIYERYLYSNQIQENTILAGIVVLTGLLFTAQIAFQRAILNSIEMELLENLELLQFAPEQDLLAGTLFIGIDYDVYTPGSIIPAKSAVTLANFGDSSLLPYPVYRHFREDGGTRLTRWNQPDIGPKWLTGYRTIRSEQGNEYSTVAVSKNPNDAKYTDRLLQDMSFWTSVFIVTLIIVGYGSIRTSKNLLNPLQRLRLDMRRSADGRMDTLMNIQANNEIAEIAGIYNSMVFKIKDLQDEVADSERKAVWAEIARQVAHEIKNPLTPMKLNIQHLYQQFEYGNKSIDDLRPAVRRITDTVIQEIDSLSNIASDFSRFARPMSETLARKDLNSVLKEVTDLYAHDRRIIIRFDPSTEPILIDLATDELKRVAVNLIKNATEAIGQSGVIAVRTYATQRYAYFEVVDNGAGINKEDQSVIFNPNFSTKDGGTGLGLAMSKKIILAHKGDIRFASVESIGSTFTVQIPLPAGARDLNPST